MKFHWKLFPLQCKLEWDLDAAKGRLAACLRECDDAAALLHSLEGAHAQQAGWAAKAMQSRLNPELHGRSLAYLADRQAQILGARLAWRRMQDAVAAARAECLRCRQRLDQLERVREQAMAQHTGTQRHRQARDADSAWLARSGWNQ